MDKQRLVVCAIFKNEAPYLLEWLAHHRVVGVQHFVLYDNDSTDDAAALIRNSPFAEQVTRIHWPQRPGKVTAYRHFIDIFAPGFEWAAFIDIDEFLLPLNGRKIQDALEQFGNASAVLVHNRVFGPGPWQDRAPGLVIENYDLRAPDDFAMHRHVKSILRCADLQDVTQDPDEFRVKGPVFNTMGYLVPMASVQDTISHRDLVINHYHTRSRQDWRAKCERGSATAESTAQVYSAERVEELATLCLVKDETIKAFASEVRALLGPGMAAAPVPPIAAPMATAPSAVAAEAEATPVPPPVAAATAPVPAPVTRPASPLASPSKTEMAPGWIAQGPDAQARADGLAMIYRDRSRPGAPWLAALCGDAAALIDPTFLLDEAERLYDFPNDAAARAACEAALAEWQGGS